MIVSLIKVRSVCLSEMATGFAGKAQAASKDFPFDTDMAALFVSSKLSEGQWILTMDRTFWEFGKSCESRILRGRHKLGDISVCISSIKLSDGELLIAAGFDNPETALKTYAERWQIETMFACLKTKGFRFESTHLKDPERIDKPLGIVTIAFVWAYLVGEHLDEINPINIKKLSDIGQKVFSDTDMIFSEYA